MIFSFLTTDITISPRKFFASTILTSGTLAWFFLYQFYFDTIFTNFTQDFFWIQSGRILFYAFGIISAIIGLLLAKKVNQRKILWTWITLGVISSASIALFHGQEFTILFGVLLGFSLGLGLPSSMAFLADSTKVEERGRVSGTTILFTFLMAFITLTIIRILGSGALLIIFLAAILRSVSFFALIIDKNPIINKKEYAINELEKWIASLNPNQMDEVAVIACEKCFTPRELMEEVKENTFYGKMLVGMFNNFRNEVAKKAKKETSSLTKTAYKEFFYYLFPWMIFVVASGLAWNLFSQNEAYLSAVSMGTVFRYAFIAIFGFVWGVVADRVGRKQPIIIGLIILGVSFALLAFTMSEVSVLLYLSASGIAWGAFLTIYLIIPGDLSPFGSREKFYALMTILPLIILFTLPLIDTASITNFSPSSFSQILSILLFISIIPVLRARETLQESKIRTRKMKEYTEKIGKIIQESKKTK
jgi:MFS family permease